MIMMSYGYSYDYENFLIRVYRLDGLIWERLDGWFFS